MATQRVEQGKFNFTPDFLTPRIGCKKIGWWITFGEGCNYVHAPSNAVHQRSWLKAGGLLYNINPAKKHENSALSGFRYTPEIDLIELLDYWHVDGHSDHGIGRDPVASVQRREEFAWWLEMDYDAKTVAQVFYVRGEKIVKVQQFTKLPKISWQVGAWAGGQIPATQDMSFDLTRIRRWVNGLPEKV